jgi:arsenical pump membrane protein
MWNSFIDNTSINPLQILALFFSMTFLSIVLDEVGFFEYLASLALRIAKNNQYVLFIILYGLISLLTIFASNDIIIITFTPFIIFFAKNAKINPLPYLISEFVAANTWSMLFIIGNPTNIYLGSSFNITFTDYFLKMALPTFFAGIISFLIMFLLFRKELKNPLNIDAPLIKIKDKFILIVGVTFLVSTIILMAISNIIHIPMYLICSCASVLLLIVLFVYSIFKHPIIKVAGHSLKRLPYSLIPFILSMFVIVFALTSSGITSNIAALLNNNTPILSYGLAAFVSANLINNIPMSVLFVDILNSNVAVNLNGVYATIIASNIAAFFTPIGALAGIMYMSILKDHEIHLSFAKFTLYGLIISIPTLFMAFLGLFLISL